MTLQGLLSGMLVLALALPAAAQSGIEERYRAGAAAFEGGRTFEALELLGSVAAEDPRYRDVQILLGQASLVVGLVRPAKQHFELALKADPRNGHVAFLLGFALYQAARYFEAAEALNEAHHLAPQNPHPLIYRGLALIKLGRPQEARQAIQQALQWAPEEPLAMQALAELELAQGRFEAAEKRLRTALHNSSQGIDARILLGRVLLESGKTAEAAQTFGALVTEFPRRSDVLYLLAQAQLRHGDREEGLGTMARFQVQKTQDERIRVLQLEVSIAPQNAEARLRLMRALLDDVQPSKALLHFSALGELLPGDPRVRALGEELSRQRRRPQ